MNFTGERMIPEINEGKEIYLEHIARYEFIKPLVKNKKVLDIACGSGYGTFEILNSGANEVIGIDISSEAIEYCKNKYRGDGVKFLIGSVDNIPLDNDSVDVVISFETLEHVNENAQKLFLSEVKRILKKDGTLIVSTPNSKIVPKGNKFHLKELDINEFSGLLGEYFSNTKLFYQDDVDSTYIVSEEKLLSNKISKWDIKCFNLKSIKPNENLFFIGVCSDNLLKNLDGFLNIDSIFLSYQKSWKKIDNAKLELILENKNRDLQNKNEYITLLEDKIRFIQSSRFWALRNKYLYAKSGFKFLLCHPIKFIKKRLNYL